MRFAVTGINHMKERNMSLNTKFDELLEFPCQFPFKVLGVAHPELADQVVAVLQQHAPGDYSPTTRPSAKGNYVSVTVTVTATSTSPRSCSAMAAICSALRLATAVSPPTTRLR